MLTLKTLLVVYLGCMHMVLCRQYHSKYLNLPGQYLAEEGVTTSVSTSPELCAYLCSKDEGCMAYSYTREQCHLSNLRPVLAHSIGSCGGSGSESGTNNPYYYDGNTGGITDTPTAEIECHQFSNVTIKAVTVLERTNLASQYESCPASKSVVNSTWYSYEAYGISFDECVNQCTLMDMCTGFHYDPNLQGCGFLNYTQSYSAKSRGAGDVLFYLLAIDTTIARGKPAELSTQLRQQSDPSSSKFLASNGNDGIYDSDYNFAGSTKEAYPYWRVDLVSPCRVYALNFYNRVFHRNTDIREEVAMRTVNPQVRIGMTANITHGEHDICGEITGPIPEYSTLIPCTSPQIARFVSFHINDPNPVCLQFYEIEIHGIC